jgi:nucleotidyltransferase/DNA polymerase involved in DNA repair
MVVCMHLPRFELAVAAGGGSRTAEQSLAGRALAVSPANETGGCLGEVSGAAEARGVARGMLLGEALARCPELVLVPADPVLVGEAWERAIRALESIGAAVEAPRPGLAYFEADGLYGLHGSQAATISAARRALDRPVRIGGGPTRFCALAAALAARSRRALVLEGGEARRWLAARPVGLLAHREETTELSEPLQRLGIRTLGELRRLGREALGDRFGAAGTLAHDLAWGDDGPLRPCRPQEGLEEAMEVGDASSGVALQRVLGVLVARLLARPERRGRTLRDATLSARLVAGGGWREQVVFRQATSDPERIWLALSLRLGLLPAPAGALRLSVSRFGPVAGEQGALLDQGGAVRAARLREAVAQMRAVAGRDAALRAVCVDPDSRVPERRVVLAPVPD